MSGGGGRYLGRKHKTSPALALVQSLARAAQNDAKVAGVAANPLLVAELAAAKKAVAYAGRATVLENETSAHAFTIARDKVWILRGAPHYYLVYSFVVFKDHFFPNSPFFYSLIFAAHTF